MIHTPVQSFHGNWLWWQAAALAHYVVRWLRVFALPQPWHRVRGKRLRLALLNVAARVTRSARRLHLRLPRHYPHATMFIAALRRIRALPAIRLTGPVRPQASPTASARRQPAPT